jgi:hypothetical protein
MVVCDNYDEKDSLCKDCVGNKVSHLNACYKEPDKVNPSHYGGTACIEEMRALYGDEAVRYFCLCNAFKYKYRAGKKIGESRDTDLSKAKWYLNYISEVLDNE